MDISDFYQTFFDEADELLADMEKHLLELDFASPDTEMLNAIFRAAHSIKGGAGTFGFTVLQETTHIMENLLDDARRGELCLSTDIINLFLESKDIMQDQLDAYKSSQEPDQETFRYICEALRQIALDDKPQTVPVTAPVEPAKTSQPESTSCLLTVSLRALSESDKTVLLEELTNLGDVHSHQQQEDRLQVELQTSVSAEDIQAVLCFVLEPEQITITAGSAQPAKVTASATPPPQERPAVPAPAIVSFPTPKPDAAAKPKTAPRAPTAESSSLRVAVEKVDQIINQVGELIITQAMLSQLSGVLDPQLHDQLISSIGQMERNARDLQESVMSIRMMPMEYVFSRFPRLVHDLGSKLNKDIELTLKGGSAELDKSLIERIIDPLTHLVRNSLDHGIETVEARRAAGKATAGQLVLSAAHHGGNIVIEVSDDGAGLRRDKILAKAMKQGMQVNEQMSDDEVWQLIFMPGFSTAEQVTDISGRGVGMDVVKRNIQAMGGHVEIQSREGRGTTTKIVLPLTLAILDGMSVKVGSEIFILPLNFVMESLQPVADDIYTVAGGERVVRVRGEYLPLVALHQVFEVVDARTEPTQGIITIIQSEGRRFAMLIDELVGQQQVVVKNLETNYRKVHGISAATILGDGRVALIVDVAALNRENRSAHGALTH